MSCDQRSGREFVFRPDVLQLREKRLHDELRDLLHYAMKARITKAEARGSSGSP